MSDHADGASGTSFAELIAPTDVHSFFDTVLGRRWLHVPGSPEKTDPIFSWDDLNTILAMDVWTASTVSIVLDGQQAPPMAFCERTVNRNKLSVLRPDRAKMMELLRQGASLVLDDIGSLVPSVGAVVETLKRTFHARAAANLYFSQRRVQAFHSHFDRHDVFALQIHGQKRWRIYRGRADAPIEHERFYNVPQAEYDRLKGELDREVTMTPGDLLYLPRGQCHDALAVDDASLHVTFSCARSIGLELLRDMSERMVKETLFRADLPHPDTDDDAALAAHVRSLLARLDETYRGPEGLDLVKSIIRAFPDDAGPELALPSTEAEKTYSVAPGDWRVVRRGPDYVLKAGQRKLPLDADESDAVRWIVGRERFKFSELTASVPEPAAAKALARLRAHEVVT